MKAVRFDQYGGIDVLKVVDVPQPVPGAGQVLVQVKAAGINPGEAKIRDGLLHARWPATFPSGQGSDLAGIVAETGAGVTGVSAGDEVIGWTDNRASQAEYVVVEEQHLTAKPAGVSWEAAGALFVAGATAYAAVRAVSLTEGDTVVVAGAAGGVGVLAVQLARRAGATVIGLASETHHSWLAGHGVIPVTYGDGVADRIRQAAGQVDAFIDTFGAGYVELALELGVEPSRVDTIANFEAVAKFGVKAEGNAAGASASVLAELAGLIAAGQLEVPIAAAFPLERVQDAYRRARVRPHARQNRPPAVTSGAGVRSQCMGRWRWVGVLLPLFPLGTVLYPGMLLPLHIFEERYRQLVRDLLERPEPRQFGVIAIRKGRETGIDGVHSLYPIGCIAALRRVERLEDGRFDLVTVGTERFRLNALDQTLPYLQGEIEPLGADAADEAAAAPLVRTVHAAFRAYLDALTERGGATVQVEDLPAEPVLLSYVVAAAMVVDLPEHQALLGEPDTIRRLAAERALLSRETAVLRATTSRPAPDLRYSPYNPN